jgi:hypothetical protein
MRSITLPDPVTDIRVRRRLALPSPRDHFKAQHEVPPAAPLSGPFPAMPDEALQLGPASAPFAMRYVGVPLAVQAPVTETDIGYKDRKRLGAGF